MTLSVFQNLLLAWGLAAVRIGAAFAICPALSDSMIMGTARRCAVLGFSALLVPQVLAGMPAGTPAVPFLVAIALREVFIGMILGFFASIPFWVAENVGNFIDNQRGATMGEVYSPLSGTQVSSTGILFTQIVSTIFFVSGAIFVLLGALYASFEVWPIFGDYVAPVPGSGDYVLMTLDGMMRRTVVIAAPVIILMFLATLGLGLVNRTAPQLNVFFLSMPIKSGLGIAMLVIYLPYIMDMLMYKQEGDILGPAMRILH